MGLAKTYGRLSKGVLTPPVSAFSAFAIIYGMRRGGLETGLSSRRLLRRTSRRAVIFGGILEMNDWVCHEWRMIKTEDTASKELR